MKFPTAKQTMSYILSLSCNYKTFMYIRNHRNYPSILHLDDISAASDTDCANLFNGYFLILLSLTHPFNLTSITIWSLSTTLAQSDLLQKKFIKPFYHWTLPKHQVLILSLQKFFSYVHQFCASHSITCSLCPSDMLTFLQPGRSTRLYQFSKQAIEPRSKTIDSSHYF